jgi:hypothetical protein
VSAEKQRLSGPRTGPISKSGNRGHYWGMSVTVKLDIMERCILSSSSAYYSEKGLIYHVWQLFLRSRSKVNEQSGEVSGDKTWDQTMPKNVTET